MRRCRAGLLVTLLSLSGNALGRPDAVCPGFPADDRAHGGDTFTVGDWTLTAGAWLATCADGHALWVACSEGGVLTVRLLVPALGSPSYTWKFGDGGMQAVGVGPLTVTNDGIAVGEADVERLVAMLREEGGALRISLTPTGDGAAAREVVFATAGFEEALPWLGCGDADACPARSCGP
ncbi:MAG: hypothetical protein ACNA8N_12735 [Trueperaceae bacterium]